MRFNLLLLYQIIVIILNCKINEIYSDGHFYKTINNKQYYIENEQKYTWFDALNECLEKNLTLVSIETSAKSNEINDLVRKTFGESVLLWVGGIGSHYPNSHKYKWIATGAPFNYTLWDDGEPNFRRFLQYCIQIGWSSNMKWADYTCNIQNGFICEEHPQRSIIENLQEMENKLQLELKTEKDLVQTLKEQLQQVMRELQNEIKAQNKLQKDLVDQQLQCNGHLQKLLENINQVQQKQQECQDILEKQKQENEQKICELEPLKEEEKNEKYRNFILQVFQNNK